jgi:P-type Ca2+ transporter type 2C
MKVTQLDNNWHNLDSSEVIKSFGLDVSLGLDSLKIGEQEKIFGKNKLPKEKQLSQLKIFLSQLKSPLIYILIFAGVITFFLKEYTDALIISVAVVINTIVGFIQESKSSKALNKLKKVLSLKAIVLREGQIKEIQAEDLVPGDIIFLRPGDKVPADGRLIEVQELKINESALTGEWLPAEKEQAVLPAETSLADRDNMVYMGTIVDAGKGKAIVIGTGLKTEIGQITNLVRETKEEKTPYQKKLARFSKTIGLIISLVCLAIFVEGLITGGGFIEMFTTSVAVAVASIPEGLPAAMTVILAIGMQRIYKKEGLVRKLSAAETLGNTSVIATDKTGTLTEAKMTVAGVFALSKEDQEEVIKYGVLCNEAFIENPEDDFDNWIIRGTPTEKAILENGYSYNLIKNDLDKTYPKLDEIIFSSVYKYSVSLRQNKNENLICFKGSPEVTLLKSKYVRIKNEIIEIDQNRREELKVKYEELSALGYRVLGVAFKKTDLEKLPDDHIGHADIDDLVFSGFIYLEDPVRESAKDALRICLEAGMKPIIITGDNKLTAKAVANKLGLKAEDENILEGKELDKLSDEELDQILEKIKIYARVEPKHKSRIVLAWQRKGEIVAMTGDGINDAPALKQANIGVALGSGTEVAKEVADLVLLSDDFSVIVAAVEEGRSILDNIRKVITYLLSDSFTEVILIGVAMFLGLPLPVTAAQILWINLIEDGLPGVALAFESKEDDLMKRKPQGLNVPLLNKEMKIIIFIIGLITDLILLSLFFWLSKKSLDLNYMRTIIFACLAIDSISYVFCCKSLRHNLWKIKLFDNKLLVWSWVIGIIGLLSAIYIPGLNNLLGTTPLGLNAWAIIIVLAIINVALIEGVKYYFIARHKTD